MKVSRAWLNRFFKEPLPDVEELADALTFHAAEVEEVEGDMMDVKVLPDRAAYMLSHRGVARELAAALPAALKEDPLAESVAPFPATATLAIEIPKDGSVLRYIGARISGVKVGPSPDWLREALAAVGQRSINNVVDAANYVMLDIGQPLHAFDADKLESRDGVVGIEVRETTSAESITTLTGELYALPQGTLLIRDTHAQGAPLAIAGIKGGEHAAVTEHTTNLVLESATFDGTRVRRTAQALKLFTDASTRYQNKPAPELAAYGMRHLIDRVLEIAGGMLDGVVDVYPAPRTPETVSVSLAQIQGVIGQEVSVEAVCEALDKLGIPHTKTDTGFVVRVPFERRDLVIAEDVIEEIVRTIGYDQIEAVQLPPIQGVPDQARYRGIEAIRDFLVERGFTEISTPSFAAEGEIRLQNPLQDDKPYLRATLIDNLTGALSRAQAHAARVLGPDSFIALFEVGTVFRASGEVVNLAMGVAPHTGKKSLADEALRQTVLALESELLSIASRAQYTQDGTMMELTISTLNLEKLGQNYVPMQIDQGVYRPYSVYPSALRDVAVWVPEGVQESEVHNVIVRAAGEHLARIDRFDRFAKDGRVSYAFRLVFESFDRTLSDTDLDPAMVAVTEALNAREGFVVR